MAIGVPDVIEYVGAEDTDEAVVTRCLAVAEALVTEAFATAWRPVPTALREQVTLDTAHAIWKRQDSPTGQSQFVTVDGVQPIRSPYDPLAMSRPIIRRYVMSL